MGLNKKFLSLAIAMGMMTATSLVAFANFDNVVQFGNDGSGNGYAIVENQELNTDNLNTFRSATKSKYIKDSRGNKILYWIYGEKSGKVTSKAKAYKGYYGRASVTNGEGEYDDGDWKKAGKWSEASAPWTKAGTNKANYDYKEDN
ncbi:MAG: hypothetical protein N4A54_02685 [Peptostreptococcaceae bacterium]|jgi:hypothetical protein|nr:hypothetical protein [Peptostreptococcaceae bacterium]